uniref:Uncharacterized protein n=1 Tax=Shigella sonnei TaxID=624 RepID=A0A2I7QFY5_SHISO|nr:hypothetical protein pDE105_00084 [Shigella sonnei]
MKFDVTPQLRIAHPVKLGQSCITAVVVQPQLAVNHKGSQNDAAGISTHGTVKPVCTVHYVETVAIRHHVAATVRQADEVPESAFIFRHHFFRQRVHRRFDIQKILAKQVRQKKQTVALFNIQSDRLPTEHMTVNKGEGVQE